MPLLQKSVERSTREETVSVDQNLCVTVPASASTLDGFRQWSYSPEFPERGKITFLAGEIIIDMSPERLVSHVGVKTEVTRVLANRAVKKDLGEFYTDGTRIVNEQAEVSNEPDAAFVSWKSFEENLVRMVPTKEEDGDYIELEGTPDWVLEIVSPSSVGKDTKKLRKHYHLAGIPEYWLIDVRGDKVSFQVLRWTAKGYVEQPAQGGWKTSRVFRCKVRLRPKQNRLGKRTYRLELK